MKTPDKKIPVRTAIERSRKLPEKIKQAILPYVVTSEWGGSRYVNGVVYELKVPAELMKISRKAKGVSMGADKNGFFVHTHRARSKSKSSFGKITKKEIDFVESTG